LAIRVDFIRSCGLVLYRVCAEIGISANTDAELQAASPSPRSKAVPDAEAGRELKRLVPTGK